MKLPEDKIERLKFLYENNTILLTEIKAEM